VCPLRPEVRQDYSLSPHPLNIVLKVLTRETRREKEIKGIKIRKKEAGPSLFVDNMILQTI
jgi:hypothetical protein